MRTSGTVGSAVLEGLARSCAATFFLRPSHDTLSQNNGGFYSPSAIVYVIVLLIASRASTCNCTVVLVCASIEFAG